MKKIGILYDNISGNTGDVAIGLSLKWMLRQLNVEFDELIPGNFNPLDYETIIIGGGYLLRENRDFFYDKFRVPGNHVLNAMGIFGEPQDLDYLRNYKFISVRSNGDKQKLAYLNKAIHVIPCTTMLLEDIPDLPCTFEKPSLGIHIFPMFTSEWEEEQFIQWASSLPFHIYFIPITHYNKDIDYMRYLHEKIPNSELLPILKAQEIFTIVGKFDYFISCSLHGGIFSYVHNVPFILLDTVEKMGFFMEDRNLDQYLFKNFSEMQRAFEALVKEQPDYSEKILTDKQILADYMNYLRTILPVGCVSQTPGNEISDQSTYQIGYLLSDISELERRNNQQFSDFNKRVHQLEAIVRDRDDQVLELSNHARGLEAIVRDRDDQVLELSNHAQGLEAIVRDRDDQVQELSNHAQGLEAIVRDRDDQVLELSNHGRDLEAIVRDRDDQVQELSNHNRNLEGVIAESEQKISEMSVHVRNLEGVIAENEQKISEYLYRLQSMRDEINSLTQSITYQMSRKFQVNIIDRLFPPGNKIRAYYNLGLRGGRLWVRSGFWNVLTDFRKYRRSRKAESNNSIKPECPLPGSNLPTIPELEKGDDKPIVIPDYVPLSNTHLTLTKDDIKFIAFYLPQFHPIPENDEWWGRGFTEWTNVTRAVPQFKGHYQPHFPDDLGYYDLRLVEVQKRQIELAKQYGIFGFCYHYYWFNGKRLLERPLNQILEHPELDLPFCICWANENWTRRWDGQENEILIAQQHSPESDLQFIKDLEPILKDPRYIRIDGKPMVLVYRATLLPDPVETTGRWREFCRKSGIGEIFLVTALCFGCDDPRKYGFDAAVEFPPHTMANCIDVTAQMQIKNLQFSGRILDYAEFVRSRKYMQEMPFKVFRAATPGWDNTPRRPNNATIYSGATPRLFKEWLLDIARLTLVEHPPGERIVFINAWNEWAEGTHLEPDRKFGYGYLQAAAEVVRETRPQRDPLKKKIILVSHDAHLHGAQMLALNIARVLKEQLHYDVQLLLKSGGRLEEQFKRYCTVYNLGQDYQDNQSLEALVKSLRWKGFDVAICNTVVTGDIVELLANNGINTISLIHELSGVIRQFHQEDNLQKISRSAGRIVFPSEFVRKNFLGKVAFDPGKTVILPQGLFLKNNFKDNVPYARKLLRERLQLPGDAIIILNVGYGDHRKGLDIFIRIADRVVSNNDKVFFVWVGLLDTDLLNSIRVEIEGNSIQGRILFPGLITEDLDVFYSGADLFLLTSREDPFPSVVLDAMNVGVPVIGFEDAGGFQDIVTRETGILVPYLAEDRMSEAVTDLLNDSERRSRLGKNASDLIEKRFNFVDYVYLLLGLLSHPYKKVSVIVPNYNYKHYLEGRLKSILAQNYPVYEMIILDDCSSDGSAGVIREFARTSPVPVKTIINSENSGSVFRQWARGIAESKGDFIWIAEADDLCEESFLREVMKGFEDDSVILSYSESRQIDDRGKILAEDYQYYTHDIDENKWKVGYTKKGTEEISDVLAIKNTIPNVSAVVFKKRDISGIIDDLTTFKVAGDWYFYVWLLEQGNISFNPSALNVHRRHVESVTRIENPQIHYEEIRRMQDYIIHRYPVKEFTIQKALRYRKEVHRYLYGE